MYVPPTVANFLTDGTQLPGCGAQYHQTRRGGPGRAPRGGADRHRGVPAPAARATVGVGVLRLSDGGTFTVHALARRLLPRDAAARPSWRQIPHLRRGPHRRVRGRARARSRAWAVLACDGIDSRVPS